MKLDKKNKILILGILFFLFVSFKVAISNTLLLRNESKKLTSDVSLFTNMPKQLSILKQKEIFYDSLLNKMNLGDTSIQNNLLRTINQEAKNNNVVVIDFNQPHVYKNGENNINTFSFKLQGTFINILTLINNIEQKGNFGEVVHITFEKKKNYKTNRYNLSAIVFVQHLE